MRSPGRSRPALLMVAVALIGAVSMIVVSTSRAQFGAQTFNAANVFVAAAQFDDCDVTVADLDGPTPAGIGEVVTVGAEVVNQIDAEAAFDLNDCRSWQRGLGGPDR